MADHVDDVKTAPAGAAAPFVFAAASPNIPAGPASASAKAPPKGKSTKKKVTKPWVPPEFALGQQVSPVNVVPGVEIPRDYPTGAGIGSSRGPPSSTSLRPAPAGRGSSAPDSGRRAASSKGRGRGNRWQETRSCNVCGEKGHVRQNCPDMVHLLCTRCGHAGHKAKACKGEAESMLAENQPPRVPTPATPPPAQSVRASPGPPPVVFVRAERPMPPPVDRPEVPQVRPEDENQPEAAVAAPPAVSAEERKTLLRAQLKELVKPFDHNMDDEKLMAGSRLYTIAQIAAAWVRTYKPRVTEYHLDEVCAAFGLNPETDVVIQPQDANNLHNHPIQAILREKVTYYCISELVLRGFMKIDALWGNDRDTRIAARLSKELEYWGHPPVEITICGPHVVAEDMGRREPGPIRGTAKAAYMVDVYSVGGTAENQIPMSFDKVREFGYEFLFWCGHKYVGRFGSFCNSAWIRVGNMIRLIPDEVSGPYPMNPPCEEMHEPQCRDGYGMHQRKVFSILRKKTPVHGYTVMQCQPTDMFMAPTPVPPVELLEGDVPSPLYKLYQYIGSTIDWIPQGMLRVVEGFCLDYLPRSWFCKRVSVFSDHFRAMNNYLTPRRRTVFTYQSAHKKAVDLLEFDPLLKPLLKHYPLEFAEYQNDLVLMTFTYAVSTRASSVRAVASLFGEDFSDISTSVDSYGRPVKERSSGWAGAGLLGVASLATIWGIKKLAVGAGGWGPWIPLLHAEAVKQTPLPKPVLPDAAEYGKKVADYTVNAVAHGLAALNSLNRQQIIAYTDIVFLSPVLEEAVKRIFDHKAWKVCSSMLLACADVFSPYNRQCQAPGTIFLVNTVLHFLWSLLPFKYGVVVHSLFNIAVMTLKGTTAASSIEIVLSFILLMLSLCGLFKTITTKPIKNELDYFDERHYGDQGRAVIDLLESEDGLSVQGEMRVDQIVVPSVESHPVSEPARDPTVRIQFKGEVFEPSGRVVPGYYRLIAHNAPMYRPANSSWNLKQVAVHRLAKHVIDYDMPHVWDTLFTLWGVAGFVLFERPTWIEQALAQDTAYRCLSFFYLAKDATKQYVMRPTMPLRSSYFGWQRICGAPSLWHKPDDAWCDADGLLNFERWLTHCDAKHRQRYEASWHTIMASPLTVRDSLTSECEVNVKNDEVLLKYAFTDEDNGFIPRPIHAVAAEVAVSLGPEIYFATEVLKHEMCFASVLSISPTHTISHHTLDVSLTYGPGMTAEQVTEWFHFACELPGLHCLIAGDDFVVVIRDGDALRFVVGDLSQCDHSVRQPMLAVEWRVLFILGVPKHSLELLMASSHSMCRLRRRKEATNSLPGVAPEIEVLVERGAERNTGGVDTTVGNTIVVATALAMTLTRTYPNLDVSEVSDCFLMYGFKVKVAVTGGDVSDLGQTFFPPDFLKGTWWPTPLGRRAWTWGPLLSRLLKITKTMTDPRVVFKHLPNAGSIKQALIYQMVAVAKGMVPFTFPEPVKGWLLNYARHPLSAKIDAPVEDLHQAWKIVAHEAEEVHDDWVYQAADRYGVHVDMVKHWVAGLLTTEVGQFYFHPFWLRMAIVDYN